LPIIVDDSRRPIVTVRFIGSVTDEEFHAYLREMEERVLGRKQPYVSIYDATLAVPTPATQRKMQAEWLRQHRDILVRCSLGVAFVIRSPLVRGVLTAILWMQPLEWPHVVVPTVADAEAWVRARLREAGLSPPT
jgi:hypothetical protein